MRTLVSPEFSAKISALGLLSAAQITELIGALETSDKESFLAERFSEINLLGENVYVFRRAQLSVYFTFGQDDDGDYALLLDATAEHPSSSPNSYFSTKNPKTNSTLNPRFNKSINPKFNSSINPKFNSSINPKFNSSINPKFNSSINPKFNSSINPKFNSSINPKFNSSINPKFNSSINPRINRTYGGPYFYDIDLDQKKYSVRASDNVELQFGLDGRHLGQIVTVNDDIRVLFDAQNNWEGYLVRADDDVALWYSVSGDWLGIFV